MGWSVFGFGRTGARPAAVGEKHLGFQVRISGFKSPDHLKPHKVLPADCHPANRDLA